MKVKEIYCYDLDEVEEITLLSAEEWKKAKRIKNVPRLSSWWWLRSPGNYSYSACYVYNDGSVYSDCYIHSTYYGIRPAFRIPNLKSKTGHKIIVGNTLCTVIDESYALSDKTICNHRFDPFSSDYEKSEIKRYINSNKFKGML